MNLSLAVKSSSFTLFLESWASLYRDSSKSWASWSVTRVVEVWIPLTARFLGENAAFFGEFPIDVLAEPAATCI